MLNKKTFLDIINIRYGWPLSRTPTTYTHGSNFNIQNALTCEKGGFITLRHNRVRNVTTSLLKELLHDICIEPILQKLTGERFEQRTTKTLLEEKLDVAARKFLEAGQIEFFDIRVFYSNNVIYANQICQPDMPTRYANQICHPDMPTRYANQICQPDMPTRYANQIYQPDMPTRYANQICQVSDNNILQTRIKRREGITTE